MVKIQNILLYLMFSSVIFGEWQIGSNAIFSIVKLVGVLYMAAVMLMPKGFFVLPRKFKPIYIPLVLFLLFLTIMNLININDVSSKWFNTGMYQWTLMLLILVNHERMRPLTLTRGMLAFAMGALLMSLLYILGVGVETDGGRVSIFGENQNAIGIRMAIAIIVILYHIVSNPIKLGQWRFLLLAATIPMMILLIDTGSRLALISILSMLLALVFSIRIRNGIARLFYIALVAGVFGATIYGVSTSDIMSSRIEATIETKHLSGRDVIWESLIPIIAENPVVGVGETGYTEYVGKGIARHKSPHNVILELMCYTGIVGTLIYLTFIFMMVRGAFFTFRNTRNFLPVLLFIPVFGLMMAGQAINTKTMWCIYAYISGTYVSQAALWENRNQLNRKHIQEKNDGKGA